MREILNSSYSGVFEAYEYIENVDPKFRQDFIADLGRNDRFYLLTRLLNRHDVAHPWLYERCREVQAEPDGHLDLWAREHGKSSLISFAGSIQEILNDPEITIGIFSHTRPIAKSFLIQIQQELEMNEELKALYPDVLYANPRRESPRWSVDNGIVVRRQSNPKEATVEAWGLVDGQPTSRHFRLMIYDDVVTDESVSTADQIEKTTHKWELSQNLGAFDKKLGRYRQQHIGTRYSLADTYHAIMEKGVVKPRVYPATDDGTIEGKPVFWDDVTWQKKVASYSLRNVACQLLQNPLAGAQLGFKEEWLREYEVRPLTMNVAILCDPAGSLDSKACRTAFAVIGIDYGENKYLLDGACHRMSLEDRWQMLLKLYRRWSRAPGVQSIRIGYEKYGMQADIEHHQKMMRLENKEHFDIQEVNWPRSGPHAKDHRIERLEPDFRNWRFFLPYHGEKTHLQKQYMDRGETALIAHRIMQRDENGQPYDLVEYFKKHEYRLWPATTEKDLLDCMSRIYDLDVNSPVMFGRMDLDPEPENIY